MGNKAGNGKVSSRSASEAVIKTRLKDKADAYARSRTIKLLLYGTGESGKTTVLRQMHFINKDNLLKDRIENAPLIRLNVIEGAAYAIKSARKVFNWDFTTPEARSAADLIMSEYEYYSSDDNCRNTELKPSVISAIQCLKGDQTFQKILARRSQLQIADGWDYLMHRLEEDETWGSKNWVPSEEDFLNSRIRTLGTNTLRFDLDGINYQLVDVGGQRVERRKFYTVFSNIDAVLYVVSMAEYDQVLFEDVNTNRLVEAIILWRQTVNSNDFEKTWFLFFFNKLDLFTKKFKNDQVPIKLKIQYKAKPPKPEEDDDECNLAKEWYRDLFMSNVVEKKKPQVRMYFTTALERESIKKAMQYCTTLFLSNADIGSYM